MLVSMSIPLAERSKARVCGCLLPGITGSNSAGGMDVYLLWVLCLVRWRYLRRADHSPRVGCVIVCDLETSRMRRLWPALGSWAREKKVCMYKWLQFRRTEWIILKLVLNFIKVGQTVLLLMLGHRQTDGHSLYMCCSYLFRKRTRKIIIQYEIKYTN